MRVSGRQCDYSQAPRNGTSNNNCRPYFFPEGGTFKASVNHCKTYLRHLRGFGPKKFREGGYGTGYNRPTPYAMLIGFTPGLVSRICIRALPAFKGVHPRDAFTEGRITNPQVTLPIPRRKNAVDHNTRKLGQRIQEGFPGAGCPDSKPYSPICQPML